MVMVSREHGQARGNAIRQLAYAWPSKPYRADQLMRILESAVTYAPAADASLEGDTGPCTGEKADSMLHDFISTRHNSR